MGEQLYQNCAFCHGADGQGREEYGAPAIAGLDRWYVERQLDKFRNGVRGEHPDDVEGLRMRAMARTLRSWTEVEAVAGYVSALPRVPPEPTVEGGDAGRGASLFTPCVTCHGQDAAGNQAVGAPPLAGASDWYLVRQVHKFQDGVRGTDPEDSTGAQMRPMAMNLADDQAIRDVVAHIMTLGR
jgi:cytochrome c553